MNKPFTREPRYYVIKISDAGAALTQAEAAIFKTIYAKVEQWRIRSGKTRLQGVFVEYDWPEFEPVWEMIKQRTTAADTTPTPVPWPRPYPPKDTPLVWPDLECVHEFLPTSITSSNSHRTCIYCKKIEAPV